MSDKKEYNNIEENKLISFLKLRDSTKEIKGNGLGFLFNTIDPKCEKADIDYACTEYEVWKVTDDLYEELSDMKEDKICNFLINDDSWIELNGKIYKRMEK